MTVNDLRPATREDLRPLPLQVAPLLLGAELRTTVDGVTVHLRITEVEAYHGKGTGPVPDPGSHARMGYTDRNATMWGEMGHLYVYLSHGIHSCINVVCGVAGEAGGVLLRAGEVVKGADAATARTGKTARTGRNLARGPGRLGQVMGLRHALHDGIDVIAGEPRAGAIASLWLGAPLSEVASGPRVGVAGLAGTDAYPWRFWVPDDPTVSPFRWGRGAAEAAAAR